MIHFVPENTRQDAARPHDNQAKRPLSTALPRCGSVAALRPPVSSCTVLRTSVPVCLSTGLDLCGYLNAEGLVPARHPAYKSNCTADSIRRFWIPNQLYYTTVFFACIHFHGKLQKVCPWNRRAIEMHIFLNHLLSTHAKYGILFMEKYGLKGESPMEEHNPGQRFLPLSVGVRAVGPGQKIPAQPSRRSSSDGQWHEYSNFWNFKEL